MSEGNWPVTKSDSLNKRKMPAIFNKQEAIKHNFKLLQSTPIYNP